MLTICTPVIFGDLLWHMSALQVLFGLLAAVRFVQAARYA
jgi:hypothetical protein